MYITDGRIQAALAFGRIVIGIIALVTIVIADRAERPAPACVRSLKN